MRLLLILVIDSLVCQILILCPVSDIAAEDDVRGLAGSLLRPLKPDVRLGQKRTFRHSFDHLVGGYQQAGRHSQAKGLHSFGVDGELELGGRLRW
jgi:hypothetical protein